MAIGKIPEQSFFFYKAKWTAEMDNSFITTILQQKSEGNWKDVDNSFHALLTGLGVINATFGSDLSWEDVNQRIQLLEIRFHTFKQVVDDAHTYWDRGLKCIIAEDDIWKNMFKKNVFTRAYYHSEEAEFESLATIFDMPLSPFVTNNTVINISDTTLPMVEPRIVTIVVSDDEEVMSPMPTDMSKLRQRLFDEDIVMTDHESSNGKWPYYIENTQEGPRRFLLRNEFPPRPREVGSATRGGAGSSSCASSSPGKWWYNPFI